MPLVVGFFATPDDQFWQITLDRVVCPSVMLSGETHLCCMLWSSMAVIAIDIHLRQKRRWNFMRLLYIASDRSNQAVFFSAYLAQ